VQCQQMSALYAHGTDNILQTPNILSPTESRGFWISLGPKKGGEGGTIIRVGRNGQQEPFMLGVDTRKPIPWAFLGLGSWADGQIAAYTHVRTGGSTYNGNHLAPRIRGLHNLCGRGRCARGLGGKPHH
jgi:hypothetical protein